MNKLTIDLPKIITVADYHEFDVVGDLLKTLNEDIEVEEIGFDGTYFGVIYNKNDKPKDYKKLLTQNNLCPEDILYGEGSN